MARLLDEIKIDLQFVKSHSLQPEWYKVLKIFILLGFLLGYNFLFGFVKTLLFFVIFVFLMLLVHLTLPHQDEHMETELARFCRPCRRR